MFRKALVATFIAATLGASMVPAAGAAELIVRVAPPAPRVEVVPAPRHGYVWVPGYWDYRGHRHVWVAGTYVRERPGYRYVEPRWVEHHGGWVIERGHWDRGDRDHDGVPNRFDHAPDNPRRS
jgi:hypothetical protein